MILVHKLSRLVKTINRAKPEKLAAIRLWSSARQKGTRLGAFGFKAVPEN